MVNVFKKQESASVNNTDVDEGFRVLFELFHERIFQIAFFMTKDRFTAQDIMQETFLKAFKHTNDVKDGKIVGAWLSVIATNTAIDFLRARKRRNEIAVGDNIEDINAPDFVLSDVAQEVELTLGLESLHQGMDKLSLEHRQVLILRYGVDLSYKEIADMLGVTEGTIKSRIHRAKEHLRSILQNDTQLKG